MIYFILKNFLTEPLDLLQHTVWSLGCTFGVPFHIHLRDLCPSLDSLFPRTYVLTFLGLFWWSFLRKDAWEVNLLESYKSENVWSALVLNWQCGWVSNIRLEITYPKNFEGISPLSSSFRNWKFAVLLFRNLKFFLFWILCMKLIFIFLPSFPNHSF